MIIFFNFRGFLMFLMALIGSGIGQLLGVSSDGPKMLIGGCVALLLDTAYRLISDDGHWLIPHRGGCVVFLPAWCFGLLLIGMGLGSMCTQ